MGLNVIKNDACFVLDRNIYVYCLTTLSLNQRVLLY